jgi:hypothetical protein
MNRRLLIIVTLLLIAAPLLHAYAATHASVSQSYALAVNDDQPVRNLLNLYLRLAGVAWIAVEWIAALILWRASALLHKAAASQRD